MVLAIAEFYHWLGEIGLPGPLLIAAGMVLAVASNRGKHINLPWRSPHAPSLGVSNPSAIGRSSPATKPIASATHNGAEATLLEAMPEVPPTAAPVLDATPVQPSHSRVELPQFDKPATPPKPISFTVRKPE